MPRALTRSLDRVRAALVRNDETELTDGQLLGHFVAVRDGDAFAALVRRHGPMVLGVCRRIIGDAHEAEDAFQATFLVLARRAGAVVPRERVGGWLYGVAVRTAREARSMRLRRTAKVSTQSDLPEPAVKPAEPESAELRSLLDRELDRLPEHYRLPVVLCELEGRSREEVARQLRIPQGTLSSRLAKARRLLARRLKQRGLALPSGALALSVAADVVTACPPELIGSTVRAALPYTAGQAAGLSPTVAALCQGISKMLFIARLKGVAQGVLLALLIAGIGGALVPLGAQEQPPAPKPQKELTETSKAPAEPSNSPSQFSEPKEVVLSMDSSKFMLDLDTGKTIGPPARILPEQQAMDVHPIQWQPYEQPEVLQGLSLRGLPVKPSDWESSVADFQKALANRPLKPLTEMKYDPSERATFFFRTRDGTDGILQLLELTKDPKGIRLRYKVLSTKKTPAKLKEGRIAVCIADWRLKGIGIDDGRLQLLSPDGKETAWLLEGVEHAEQPGCRIVALSPDGTQVAYGVRNNPESNGFQGPLTIRIKSVADKKPGRSLKVDAFCWAWSPDGKELAVSRFAPPPGSTTPIAVESAIVDVQTGESKPLTLPAVKLPDGAESDRHLITDWSRNGEWFLTVVSRLPNPPGQPYLFRVKRDGSKVEPVITDRAALRGRFSPDGKRVLFYGADDEGRTLHLYTAEVGKGKPWLISQDRNERIMGFCWSPDGKRIAYTAQRSAEGPGGETESFLIVVDADGKNPVTLLSEKADNAGTTRSQHGVDWR